MAVSKEKLYLCKTNTMAIVIKKAAKPKKPKTAYYLLKYNYMIGDADGDTSETVKVSIDNPFVERYCKLLNRLKPTKGTWGLSLDWENLEKCLKEKQITKDDYNFLARTMFEGSDEEDVENYFGEDEKLNDFANEFSEGVRSETEYSFLVFQGVKLTHVDEWGTKSKTSFKK